MTKEKAAHFVKLIQSFGFELDEEKSTETKLEFVHQRNKTVNVSFIPGLEKFNIEHLVDGSIQMKSLSDKLSLKRISKELVKLEMLNNTHISTQRII